MCADVRRPADEETRGPRGREPQEQSGPRRSRAAERKHSIGEYRIVAMIGEGGMAQVHLALKHGPAGFTKLLVIKSLKDHLVDPIHARSFMHEARLAAQLNHSNVVQTYEVGEDDGRLFLAMEYVEGQSLRAVQRRMAPNRLPLSVQLRILAEVARGLHHAHRLTSFDGSPLGIVHRDVSPQNVMLTYDGQVKLLDFGIAKAQGAGGDDLTRAGMIKGKLDYMAPEQLRGLAIDHRADIFSLGVMLWEALAGLRFSGGAEVAEVTKMHNRVMGAEAKLRDVAPETPMRLVEICERAISLRPEDRFDSADAFGQSLLGYLADTSKMSGPKQLSKIMTSIFAREQLETRELIERQIQAMSSPGYVADLAPVPITPAIDELTGTPRAPRERMQFDVELSDETTLPNAPAFSEATKTKALVTTAALVSIASLFVIGRTLWASEQASPSAPIVEALPTPAVAPPPAPAPAAFRVRISAIPEDAAAELDGTPITLPFDARLAADLRLHRLTVHADGYETFERGFALDRETTISIELRSAEAPVEQIEERAPQTSSRARRRAARAARRARAAPTRTTTTTTGRRTPAIDSSDPYQ